MIWLRLLGLTFWIPQQTRYNLAKKTCQSTVWFVTNSLLVNQALGAKNSFFYMQTCLGSGSGGHPFPSLVKVNVQTPLLIIDNNSTQKLVIATAWRSIPCDAASSRNSLLNSESSKFLYKFKGLEMVNDDRVSVAYLVGQLPSCLSAYLPWEGLSDCRHETRQVGQDKGSL